METAKNTARALNVSMDYLIGMYEDNDQEDFAPAGVALGGA
jgi:hypothetical protein